jgi:2-keto-4-pentenoate hydratase/2-oxohepta-3-ene-1,7-dioic acid hydratase in catechol pathway
LICSGQLEEMVGWYNREGKKLVTSDKCEHCLIADEQIEFAPIYRNPGKIWGIGLNYQAHADELSEKQPEQFPGSFMKPRSTIIGHGEYIKIPLLSNKTTAEGELGIIIGRKCKNIKPDNWLDYVAGYTNIIDVTAEDILRKNPRYLTLSKSFDSFLSIGPYFISKEEVEDVDKLKVSTLKNGKVISSNSVSAMRFKPKDLVVFHSAVMTLQPGDLISTGTPGAVHIEEGDEVKCDITGFPMLGNRVFDLKRSR